MTDQPAITSFIASGVTTSNDVRLRRAPDSNDEYNIFSVLEAGTHLPIIGKLQNAERLWYVVNLDGIPGGGYVAAEFVAVDEPIADCPTDVLNVPWVSQIFPDGSGHDACGESSVAMLLDFYRIPHDDIKTMATWLGRWGKDTGYNDLIKLAGHYGLTLKLLSHDSDLKALTAKISNPSVPGGGKPAIVLVDYGRLPFPSHLAGGKQQGWHWFVVRGIVGDTVYVNDSLWLANQRNGHGGDCLSLTVAQFEAALLPNLSNHIAIY